MHDLAVLGGGPAGMAAATEAAARGARVVLLEESPALGGQVYRAPPPGFIGEPDTDRRDGDALRQAALASGAEIRTGCRVWGLGGGPLVRQGEPYVPFILSALGADGAPFDVTSRALILCPGTTERILPFPGWTTPGVIGLAAATILLKAWGVLPGRRVVVAGVGPLLYAVAAKCLAGGARVVAVADAAVTAEWAGALPRLAARPDLLARGLRWRAALVRARVPVLPGHAVLRAEGEGSLRSVVVGPILGGTVRALDADALCVGHGLIPATEAARTYRAHHLYDAGRGGWVPALEEDGRTSVALLYAAGDGAGVRGAAAAPAAGRLAALAALRDLDRLDAPSHAAARACPARQRDRAARAGAAMAGMMALRPALVGLATPDTVICRCEGVTRAEIETAADLGAADLNQMKHFTRCGMGPCQGRLCGEASAEILAARQNVPREAVGFATGRLPLRPIPMDALLGDFDYADIPVPSPAPP